MPVTRYDKIVRDRIDEIVQKSGGRAVCEIAGNVGAIAGLEAKLSEELNEYLSDHSIAELADLLEVMRGICHHRGIPWEDVEAARQRKYAERGGFERGLVLKETHYPD